MSMTRTFRRRSAQLGAGLLAAGIAGSSWAMPLPDPQTRVSDVPVAIQYDDGWSYSVPILNYLYPDGGWKTSAGTGTLDLIITTRSAGQQNTSVADDFNTLYGQTISIPDPTTNPNVNNEPSPQIVDSWGTSQTTGNLLVKDLYNYLWKGFGTNTPVFTFDQNETGGLKDLYINAKVEILDGVNGSVLKTWSFDNTTQPDDGIYDIDSYVYAAGEYCIPDVKNNPTQTVCFSANVGSGAFDYIIYAPTMNLLNWADDDNLFKFSWVMDQVDNGGEEITLTGRFTPGSICDTNPNDPACQTVPEPGSLALLSLGLLGLGFGLRRKSAA